MAKKPPADPQSCESCRFFAPNDHDDAGYCKRLPPTPIPESGMIVSAFPVTTADGWCGEFARRLNS